MRCCVYFQRVFLLVFSFLNTVSIDFKYEFKVCIDLLETIFLIEFPRPPQSCGDWLTLRMEVDASFFVGFDLYASV